MTFFILKTCRHFFPLEKYFISACPKVEGGRRIGFVRKFRLNPLQAIKDHGTRSETMFSILGNLNVLTNMFGRARALNPLKIGCFWESMFAVSFLWKFTFLIANSQKFTFYFQSQTCMLLVKNFQVSEDKELGISFWGFIFLTWNVYTVVRYKETFSSVSSCQTLP